MLAEFQRAFADLVADPELSRAARKDPALLAARYALTPRESRRLAAVVRHPGMACNCMLYRANRLAPLAVNLPEVVRALGPSLRALLDEYFALEPRTDVHFYVESWRFSEFLGRHMREGRALPAAVGPALQRERAVLAERLELSHTEVYSPLRDALNTESTATRATAARRAAAPSARRAAPRPG